MTQQLLNRPQIGAIVQQVSGETVPQRMRCHSFFYSQDVHVFFQNSADASIAQRSPAMIQKQSLEWFGVFFAKHRTTIL